jgi:hypothetical protein
MVEFFELPAIISSKICTACLSGLPARIWELKLVSPQKGAQYFTVPELERRIQSLNCLAT